MFLKKACPFSDDFMKKVRVIGFTVLVLLLFTAVSFGSLVDLVPDTAVAVLEAGNADALIDFLYSDQLKSLTEGEFDLSEVRSEVKEELEFDALDPEFLKGLFANGITLSITGFTEVGIPEVLVVLNPKNKVSFLKLIKNIEKKGGLKEDVSSYKGINIAKISIPSDDESGISKELAWAIVGKNLVFGFTAAPVKEAIEVFKGEKTPISTSQEYQEVKNKIKGKLGETPFFLYLSMEKFSSLFEILKSKLPEEQAKSLENSAAIFSTMKPMGLSAVSGPEGTKIYGITGIPEKYKEIYKNISFPKIEGLNLFPKNTFLFIGGAIPISWEKMKALYPEGVRKAIEDSFMQLKSQIGLDIEELVLNWLDKELSVGMFDPSGMIPKMGIIIGYSDKGKAQNALNMLISMAGPSLGGTPSDKEYEGIKYKAIENPMFPVGFGFIKDRLVLASGIENMIDVSLGNAAPFARNTGIQEIMQASNVTSILYLNLNTILDIIERFASMGGGLDENTKKVLQELRKVKEIVSWGGYEEDYSYIWIKINNAQ